MTPPLTCSAETDHEDIAEDNTPTLKPLAPLPVESPEGGRKTSPRHHTSIDEARLQKAVGSIHSPPASSPSPSSAPSTPPTPPTTLPLFDSPATPPKISFSKSDFQTPSPPAGLPALPGPPSSSDEDTQKFGAQDTATKTPRPPGGWAYTPARPNTLLRTNSLPMDDENLSDHSASTPMNTTPLSRAQSLPAQTPAPPGGWLMTPAQKKSVRFDHEQESEVSTGPDSEFHSDSQAITDAEGPSVRKENGILKPSALVNTDVQVTGPSSPPASPSKSRRQARIRIVDEYGREETSQDASLSRNQREDTPRRSSIRIVDAMGRVVEDSVIEPDSVAESEVDESFVAPKSRTEGMARMQTGLTKLEQLFDTELDR
ncbi:hypothetical protein CPB85DRAFT_767050 [Mucidula mucida]|nr:hypothetical protein CPB85DRAFT_767050 [Mucidula mucida]